VNDKLSLDHVSTAFYYPVNLCVHSHVLSYVGAWISN